MDVEDFQNDTVDADCLVKVARIPLWIRPNHLSDGGERIFDDVEHYAWNLTPEFKHPEFGGARDLVKGDHHPYTRRSNSIEAKEKSRE